MDAYKGKNITASREAVASDKGWIAGTPQRWITLEDGSSMIVVASDVKTEAPAAPVIGTVKGKNVIAEISVALGDPDYDSTKYQMYVTYEDGTMATVAVSDYIAAPPNPADPRHTPIRSGASTAKETLNDIISRLVDLRNRMG